MNAATALSRHSPALVHTAVRTYSGARQQSNAQLCELLDDAGYLKLSAAVHRCCSEFRVLECAAGHRYKPTPTYHCNYRLCANCARERQRRTFARLMPVLNAYQRRFRFYRPILITLTVKSSHEPLAVHDKRFKAWFRKLRRSEKWKRHIHAAVAGFEFTWNAETGWHYHAHILAFRKTVKHYRQEELLEQWQKITDGAGQVVHIASKGTLRTMAEEVVKYVSKPTNVKTWTPAQVFDFNQLRRVKLSECYGELRGFKFDADDTAASETDNAPADEFAHLTAGSPCPCCYQPLRFAVVPRDELGTVTLYANSS